jgi:hypothetical protein
MKRLFLVLGLVFGIFIFQPAISQAQTISPVGTWEINILGADPGISMMTFSTNLTVTGYGITRKRFGLFTLTGNWGFDSHGNAVVAIVESVNGTNTAVSFTARVRRSGRFSAKGTGTSGHFHFIGVTVTDFPDLGGSWTATVKRRGKTLRETYTISASTNFPAVFDVTGAGLSDTGSYTLTGEIITTSHDKLSASIDRTFSGPDTVRSSLSGIVRPRKPVMSMHGDDDTGAAVVIKAIQ